MKTQTTSFHKAFVMEQAFFELLQVLGSTGAIAGIAFYFFDKKDIRSKDTIEKLVKRHEDERKIWINSQERRDQKMSESQERVSQSLDRLSYAIQKKEKTKQNGFYGNG